MDEGWRPFCGALWPLERTAGPPVVCTRSRHNVHQVKHRNDKLGFEWWGGDPD